MLSLEKKALVEGQHENCDSSAHGWTSNVLLLLKWRRPPFPCIDCSFHRLYHYTSLGA